MPILKFARVLCLAVVGGTLSMPSYAAGQGRATELRITAELEIHTNTLRKLVTAFQKLDLNQKLQAQDMRSLQQSLPGTNGFISDASFQALASRLDRETVVSILQQLAEEESVEDPKAEFVRIVFERLCKLEKDNCALRQQILNYEREARDLQMRQLSGSRTQHTSRYRPTPAPLLPQPGKKVESPYYLHRPSVCCRNKLCERAILIASNADGLYANGRVEHGDIYLDCNNRQVLVRNMSRPHATSRSVLNR